MFMRLMSPVRIKESFFTYRGTKSIKNMFLHCACM